MEPPAKKSKDEASSSSSSINKETELALVETPSSSLLNYDVLRIIFKFLNARDLGNAACTCRSWRDAASNEADSRRAPQYFLNKFQLTLDEDTAADPPYDFLLKALRSKPSLGLVCLNSEPLWNIRGEYFNGLPQDCKVAVLGGYSIVSKFVKVDALDFGIGASVFLPKIKDLNLQIYNVNKDTFKNKKISEVQYAQKLVKKMLQPGKSQCIIMLTNSDGYGFMKRITKSFSKMYTPGKVALWGGMCSMLETTPETPNSSETSSLQSNYWTAISLSSPFLQSWSIVVPDGCHKEQVTLARFEHFKKNITLKKNSLALMFACVAHVDRKESFEMITFQKVFPDMELIGLYGDGEYGLNTLHDERENQLRFAYTTVFLVLTYE